MADSTSPAFMPPVNTVKDNDPMIFKVPMDKTDMGFRQSAAPPMRTADMTLATIPNKNA